MMAGLAHLSLTCSLKQVNQATGVRYNNWRPYQDDRRGEKIQQCRQSDCREVPVPADTELPFWVSY